jgi:hypothetical protein
MKWNAWPSSRRREGAQPNKDDVPRTVQRRAFASASMEIKRVADVLCGRVSIL